MTITDFIQKHPLIARIQADVRDMLMPNPRILSRTLMEAEAQVTQKRNELRREQGECHDEGFEAAIQLVQINPRRKPTQPLFGKPQTEEAFHENA